MFNGINLPKSIKLFALLLVILVAICMYYRIIHGFIPIPLNLRGIYHIMILPEDLYKPIIEGNFDFCQNGYSETFPLKPKYLDTYCIGYAHSGEGVPRSIPYDGEIRADFYWKDRLITSQTSRKKFTVFLSTKTLHC